MSSHLSNLKLLVEFNKKLSKTIAINQIINDKEEINDKLEAAKDILSKIQLNCFSRILLDLKRKYNYVNKG